MSFSTGFVRADKSGLAGVSDVSTVKLISDEITYPPIVREKGSEL